MTYTSIMSQEAFNKAMKNIPYNVYTLIVQYTYKYVQYTYKYVQYNYKYSQYNYK